MLGSPTRTKKTMDNDNLMNTALEKLWTNKKSAENNKAQKPYIVKDKQRNMTADGKV